MRYDNSHIDKKKGTVVKRGGGSKTHLGGEVSSEVLAHRRLDLEDGLVGWCAQVYPAVVEPRVSGHGRHLSRCKVQGHDNSATSCT